MNSDSLSVKWGYFYKPCSVAVEIKSLINDNILSLLLDHLPPPGPAPPEAARPTRASLSPQSPPAQPASPKACPPRRGAQHSTLRAPNLGATGRGLCRGEGGGRRYPAQPQAGGSAGARGDPRPRPWPKCGEAVSLGVHSASDSGGRGLPAPWATSPLPGVPLRAGGALP